MRVLVACEFSGRVRSAFEQRGHDAWSCDLLESELPGNHFQCDVREVLTLEWDMLLAFPPCTHLAVSGARWWADRQREQGEALNFVRLLMQAPVERIAIENPVGCISTEIRRPDQIIQPFHFGHDETKKTCLWLKNLPPLMYEHYITGTYRHSIHTCPPGPDRWRERSRTFEGIAKAMASQWG
jgi:site-specific DNA-cytosine methylase